MLTSPFWAGTSACIAHGELSLCYHKRCSQAVSAVQGQTCDHECDTGLFTRTICCIRTPNYSHQNPDNDVAVIAVSLQRHLQCRLYNYNFTGVWYRMRIIDVAKVQYKQLSPLIGIHTFTGCELTSAIHGKGKRKTFSLACQTAVLTLTSQLSTHCANMCATCMANHLSKT